MLTTDEAVAGQSYCIASVTRGVLCFVAVSLVGACLLAPVSCMGSTEQNMGPGSTCTAYSLLKVCCGNLAVLMPSRTACAGSLHVSVVVATLARLLRNSIRVTLVL